MALHPYYQAAIEVLKRIEETQASVMDAAAQAVFLSLKEGGVLNVFATGHSSLVAQEAFHRAGGLVPVNPILEPFLSPLISPRKSGGLERIAEIAAVLMDYYQLLSGEVLIIISNSGINSLAVEMGLAAKRKGLTLVAITSLAHSRGVDSRHISGNKLYQIADPVIDNCGQLGDAALSYPELSEKIAPTSTLAGIFIINRIVCQVVEAYLSQGLVPPVYLSANIPGGQEHNRNLEQQYRERIKLL
ncbi:MAG: SIS domain-containing protein [Thermodesulfobacteriota bacterium]